MPWNAIIFKNFETILLYISSGVCKIANCQQGTWKQWSGVIKEGTCGTQTRIRPQILTWTTIQKTGSCSGVQTSCPEPEKESRKMCKYFLRDRTIGQFHPCNHFTCRETANLNLMFAVNFLILNLSNGVQLSIFTLLQSWVIMILTKMKNICSLLVLNQLEWTWSFSGSCSKAECSLGDWSNWEGKVEQGRCGTQKRRRVYTKETVYEQHEKQCPSLPQNCLAPVEESRAMCKETLIGQ